MSHCSDLTIADEILQLMPASERDQEIIYDRIYCAIKLDPLSIKYKISKERIRQIEKKFLVSVLSQLYSNPKSTIRLAHESPFQFKPDEFSVIEWYMKIGIQVIGDFSDDTLFDDRCVFECFLLLSKKLFSVKEYNNLKYCIPRTVSDFLSNYQLYYQASPVREYSAIGDCGKNVWRHTKRFGLVHIDYVMRKMQVPRIIAEKALKLDGYIVLEAGWYIHKNVMLDNRGVFKASLEKMFAVTKCIPVEDVYRGLSRSIRWQEGYVPDIKLLKQLLIAYKLTIKDGIVCWNKANKQNHLSLSKAEYSLVKATKAVGPVLSKQDMRYFLKSSGVAERTVWNYLLDKSPIFIEMGDDKFEKDIKFHRLVGSEISGVQLERAYARNILFMKRVEHEEEP